MLTVRVLGLDPAVTNFGIAQATIALDLLTGKGVFVEVSDLILLETETRAGKTVRKSSDDLRRVQELTAGLRSVIEEFEPTIIFTEVPSGAQSARAAFLLGAALGIIGGIAVPIIQVPPIETKLKTVGSKTASKDDMIKWAMKLHPKAPWKMRQMKGGKIVPLNANEHLADAVAVIHAGMHLAEFAQATALMRSMRGAA